MIGKIFCPGLLETGPVSDRIMAVRDGLVNFYILKAPDGLVCIDAGWRQSGVIHGFERLGVNIRDVRAVLLTHLHWDHARCAPLYSDAEVFVGEHELPAPFTERLKSTQSVKGVKGEQVLRIAGLTVQVIDTPGHTRGSVSYVIDEQMLFSGDTLRLKHGKVLPFLSWLNEDGKALNHSITKLARVKGVECLLTAHSGITKDIKSSFSRWYESSDKFSKGGSQQ